MSENTNLVEKRFLALSQLCKAAGDELRLQILCALSKGSFGVLELSSLFDIKQSGMSHHLKVLANANLVTKRKEGNSIFYRQTVVSSDDEFADVKTAIFRQVESTSLPDTFKHNLNAIYKQRSDASKAFFSDNASRFKQQQDLIASFDVYGAYVTELLHHTNPPALQTALEVGPGAGEFLDILSKRFQNVIAVDNSEHMLAAAQKRCQDNKFTNVDFVLNDTRHCLSIPESIDCAVFNMVLHHTPSPQQIFDDVATALKPGGIILMCDLCQHDQDWAREACGDLWLGFAPEDLTRWAKEKNLKEGQSSYFALRNGFQIQIREFIKHVLD